MDRYEFEKLFRSSLRDAVKRGAPELRTMPKRLRVELHGAGHGGIAMSVEEAASILYLGPEEIHKVIDLERSAPGTLGRDMGSFGYWTIQVCGTANVVLENCGYPRGRTL
jgi:hypothetical protein